MKPRDRRGQQAVGSWNPSSHYFLEVSTGLQSIGSRDCSQGNRPKRLNPILSDENLKEAGNAI
jgi:hypothetical protein